MKLFSMKPTKFVLKISISVLSNFKNRGYINRSLQNELLESSLKFLSFTEQELWLLKILRFQCTAVIQINRAWLVIYRTFIHMSLWSSCVILLFCSMHFVVTRLNKKFYVAWSLILNDKKHVIFIFYISAEMLVNLLIIGMPLS